MAESLLHLIVEKGPREGETIECHPSGQPVRIGRVVRGNTLVIKDSGISQKHLLICFDPEASRWSVTDLESSNGTLVNGALIAASVPFPIYHDDKIKMGEVTVISVRIADKEFVGSAIVAAPSVLSKMRVGLKEAAPEPEPEPEPEPAPSRRTRAMSKREALIIEVESQELEVTRKPRRNNAPKGSGRGRGRGRGGGRALKQVAMEKIEEISSGEANAAGPCNVKMVENDAGIGVDDVGMEVDDMENMTLGEWFDRMEKYVPAMINEFSADLIHKMRQQAQRFDEFVSSSSNTRGGL